MNLSSLGKCENIVKRYCIVKARSNELESTPDVSKVDSSIIPTRIRVWEYKKITQTQHQLELKKTRIEFAQKNKVKVKIMCIFQLLWVMIPSSRHHCFPRIFITHLHNIPQNKWQVVLLAQQKQGMMVECCCSYVWNCVHVQYEYGRKIGAITLLSN